MSIDTATWLDHGEGLTGMFAGFEDRGNLVAHLCDVHDEDMAKLAPMPTSSVCTIHRAVHPEVAS